jgi:cell division protein FtsW (lipid II flippase)
MSRARALRTTDRRNTELGLLVLAGIGIVGAYVLASLGSSAELPVNLVPFLVIVLGLFLGAHVALRRLAPDADPILLPIAALLNGLGYVVIAGLNQDLAGLQAMWTAAGVAAFVATLIVVRRVRDLERYRYTFLFIGLALLVLPFIPGVGQEQFGARIWVRIGPASFQPGEVTKLVLAIFFAAYLVDKRELLRTGSRRLGPIQLPDPKYLGPVLLAWGVSLVVMIAQKDLGTSLLFFGLFVVLLWVATERPSWLVVGAVLFAAGAFFSFQQFAHVQQRVDIWLDPWQDPSGDGYQIVQAAFAMAFGGLTGTGLGLGGQVRIPLAESDMIFASIGEQLGLAGGTLILVAFILMVGAGLRIALRTTQPFEKLLATGLTTLLGLQAFIIIGGVTRLLPLTGITLPFVSYGGSSLVANYVLLALLLRISDESSRRPPPTPILTGGGAAAPGAGAGPAAGVGAAEGEAR